MQNFFTNLLYLPKTIGKLTYLFFDSLGFKVIFFLSCIKSCFTPIYYPDLILKQIIKIGYNSLPVVGMTAIFTGMVLALQSYTGFSRFSAD